MLGPADPLASVAGVIQLTRAVQSLNVNPETVLGLAGILTDRTSPPTPQIRQHQVHCRFPGLDVLRAICYLRYQITELDIVCIINIISFFYQSFFGKCLLIGKILNIIL